MEAEKIVESSGNVFADLGFSPEEATLLAMRSQLMGELRLTIREPGWTQAKSAEVLGVSQSRVSDLMRHNDGPGIGFNYKLYPTARSVAAGRQPTGLSEEIIHSQSFLIPGQLVKVCCVCRFTYTQATCQEVIRIGSVNAWHCLPNGF